MTELAGESLMNAVAREIKRVELMKDSGVYEDQVEAEHASRGRAELANEVARCQQRLNMFIQDSDHRLKTTDIPIGHIEALMRERGMTEADIAEKDGAADAAGTTDPLAEKTMRDASNKAWVGRVNDRAREWQESKENQR